MGNKVGSAPKRYSQRKSDFENPCLDLLGIKFIRTNFCAEPRFKCKGLCKKAVLQRKHFLHNSFKRVYLSQAAIQGVQYQEVDIENSYLEPHYLTSIIFLVWTKLPTSKRYRYAPLGKPVASNETR